MEELYRNNNSTNDFETKLWRVADNLRGALNINEFGYAILALFFLKYLSDLFQVQHAILVQGNSIDPEDSDEYKARNIFWIPKEARWELLQSQAHLPNIGTSIDQAMAAIEKENPSLQNVFSKDYSQLIHDQRRLSELINFISTVGPGNEEDHPKEVFSRIYEYFLWKVASSQGKKSGAFYTPPSVIELLVRILEPFRGRVYDPCCGSGQVFVQSEKFVKDSKGYINDISFYGQEANLTTWRLAKMNLIIHSIEADIGPYPADTFHNDLHSGLKADFIIAVPPFNIRHWGRDDLLGDARWKYGLPPMQNANFAWLQHIAYHLAPNGVADFIMSNSSLFSLQRNELETRRAIIEADLVECIIALPSQLFYSTSIPTSLWVLANNKKGNEFRPRSNEILFIDVRELGLIKNRINKSLSEDEISRIVQTYHSWRGGKNINEYQDILGFCKSVTIDEIAINEYRLVADLYIEPTDIGERFIRQLNRIPTGRVSATDYQQLVFDILNYLFDAELIDGELEVKTYEGTERRDIIYTNDADKGFWEFIRVHYGCLFVVFEAKNVEKLEIEHINQLSNYIGVRLGLFGFIVTRNVPGNNILLKTYSVYNDTPGSIRKTILILSDEDLEIMIQLKQRDESPTQYIQKIYRNFITRLQ